MTDFKLVIWNVLSNLAIYLCVYVDWNILNLSNTTIKMTQKVNKTISIYQGFTKEITEVNSDWFLLSKFYVICIMRFFY